MNTPLKRGFFLLSSLVLFAMIAGVSGQVDQTIYNQFCIAQPDTSCFEPDNGSVDSVGRDVAALGGTFRFCLQLDTIDSGYAPIRVIMLLDRSGSMCDEVVNDQYCGCTGNTDDSSGYCMQNDPTNQRVAAAHQFVDSLRAKSPESEIGVVRFWSGQESHNPLSLSTDANVTQIHDWIDDASCESSEGNLSGLNTNLGAALEEGLDLADVNYNNLDPQMTRHIILLTDGAWDDVDTRAPDSVIFAYQRQFADRVVPAVHGVFLSDSVLHTLHGYPPLGCSSTGDINLAYLNLTTQLTGGLYMPGTTPQSIVNNFQALLDSVTRPVPQQLVELIVTNTTTGEVNSTRSATLINTNAVWETSLENLPLVFGANNLEVRQRIYSPSTRDTIEIVTNVVIIRSTLYREALDTDLFNEYCVFDSTSLTIRVTPEVARQNEPFDVEATITDVQNFRIDTMQLRVFTRFPDNESGVLATFHLDGDLANAGGGTAGTGTPVFSTNSFLFGSGAITGGSFSYPLAQLGGNFVLEAWVNPERSGGAIFSGNGFEFGVNNSMQPYFTAGSENIVTALIGLDDGAWSHIAVARTNGNIQLFINGVAVSDPVPYATSIGAGAVTVSVPNRWAVDEIRFSNNSRVTGTTLAIPTIPNTEWNIDGVVSKSEILIVPPTAWTENGQLTLQFSSPVSGRVLINMRPKSPGSTESSWSKNSNPVKVADDLEGPYVKKGTLTPAAIGQPNDTLLIEFNEPVTCEELTSVDPDQAFRISNEESIDQNSALTGAKYLDNDPCTQDFISTVKILVPTGRITPEEDSIRITRESITDLAGNAAQTDKKGQIVWGGDAELQITSIPNEPGRNLEINEEIKNNLNIPEDYGKVVRAIARRDLKPMEYNTAKGDSVYGKAMIYDPVGNLVQTNLDVFESRLPRTYYFVWDGTNRTGRRVGSGPYLIVFKFQYADGTPIIRKEKIALQW